MVAIISRRHVCYLCKRDRPMPCRFWLHCGLLFVAAKIQCQRFSALRGGSLLFITLRVFVASLYVLHFYLFASRLCAFVPLSFRLCVFVICLFFAFVLLFPFCFLAILLSCSFPFVRWFSCLVLSFLSLVAYCLSYLITTTIIIIYNILISFVRVCVCAHARAQKTR